MSAEDDPYRSCYTKKAYTDLSFAQRVAADLERRRGVKLRAYPCHICGGFHLTKRPAK